MNIQTIFERYLSPSSVRGEWGEQDVRNLLLNDEFYSIHDAHVFNQQIDHILICKKGIFAIETKNLQGTIYGSFQKNRWSQVFESNNGYHVKYKKFEFYNPIMQNNVHAQTLHRTLKWKKKIEKNIKSIVVFTSPHVNLRVFSPIIPVLRINGLIEYISGLKDIMTDYECQHVFRNILEICEKSDNQKAPIIYCPKKAYV